MEAVRGVFGVYVSETMELVFEFMPEEAMGVLLCGGSSRVMRVTRSPAPRVEFGLTIADAGLLAVELWRDDVGGVDS